VLFNLPAGSSSRQANSNDSIFNNTVIRMKSARIAMTCFSLALLISGCAGMPREGQADREVLSDPFERLNRSVFTFNDAIDRHLSKPISSGYKKVVPTPARRGITNFFNNLDEINTIVNSFLQGNLDGTMRSISRLLTNSTVGLLGLFDVATKMGVERTEEDFGQTFAVWGIGPGPYLVLPFLGPSSIRDGIGLIPGYFGLDPISYIDSTSTRWAVLGLKFINIRSQLSAAEQILNSQLDPYLFLRQTYEQRRINDIYNGNPPEEELDFFDEF
jgi:phospholipid-binding lipoprotein MlaA